MAKNYLLEEELRKLYLISEQFLSFAELKVTNHSKMTMSDWLAKLDQMLKLNDLQVLTDKGHVPRRQMEKKVHEELKKYKSQRQLQGINQKK